MTAKHKSKRASNNLAVIAAVAITVCAIVPVALSSSQRRTRVDLIVSGGTIVTMDSSRRVIEDGGIVIDGGKILSVGRRSDVLARYSSTQVISADGRVVIPGLINAHTHIPMTLFRGLADDLDLQEWLTKYIFPAEAKNVTEEFVRAGTQLGLAEMIRGGTTTYCDMYYFEDAIAEETAKAGVRGVLGQTLLDFPAPDNKTIEGGLASTEKFINRWKNDKLIVPAIAPHAPYTVSENNLKRVLALADRTGAPIVIHLSETRKEVEDIRREKGVPPIEYLERIGFFGVPVIAAHVVHPTKDELQILKRRGVGIAHNPQSNMKLASGVAPVPAMLTDDLAVGLGTDGAASNNDLNMWEEMDTVAKLHKVFHEDPRVISAQEAFEMATIRGARALHLDKQIGSIEAGKRADVVIVDLDSLTQTPLYNMYSQLVYATKANDVRTVIIEGRIVMRDRRLLTLDEKAIRTRAIVFREQVIKSLAPPKT